MCHDSQLYLLALTCPVNKLPVSASAVAFPLGEHQVLVKEVGQNHRVYEEHQV